MDHIYDTASFKSAIESTLPATRSKFEQFSMVRILPLSVYATDGEFGITAKTIPVQTVEMNEEPVYINGPKLHQMLNKASSDETRIQSEEGKYWIMCGADYELNAVDVVFPEPLIGGMDTLATEVPAHDLHNAISYVTSAASTVDGKYAMQSMLVDMTDDGMKFVCTDGKRIAVASFKLPHEMAGKQVLVPIRAAKAIATLCKNTTDTIKIECNKNHIQFSSAEFEFWTRQVEGRFPPYEKLLTGNKAHTVMLDVNALRDCVSQASVCCDKESMKVTLKFMSGRLHVSAESSRGKSTVEYPGVTSYTENKSMKIDVNPEYLIDSLSGLDIEYISLKFEAPDKPIVFDGNDNTYLIVPYA